MNRTPSRERTSLPGGVPATKRHGARSEARMPTAAQRTNWSVALGRSPRSRSHGETHKRIRATTRCHLQVTVRQRAIEIDADRRDLMAKRKEKFSNYDVVEYFRSEKQKTKVA